MRFSELSGETDSIKLIFPEGVGFIPLKDLMTKDNTSTFYKRVNLTKSNATEIHPLVKAQNQPPVAGLPKKLEQSLEVNDVKQQAK
jgi:hypothetical protein